MNQTEIDEAFRKVKEAAAKLGKVIEWEVPMGWQRDMDQRAKARKPVAAFSWHGDHRGVLVICDDGTIWHWKSEENEWEWLTDVPKSLGIQRRRDESD